MGHPVGIQWLPVHKNLLFHFLVLKWPLSLHMHFFIVKVETSCLAIWCLFTRGPSLKLEVDFHLNTLFSLIRFLNKNG